MKRLLLVAFLAFSASGFTCWELGVGSPSVTASRPVLVPSAHVIVRNDNWSTAKVYVGEENGAAFHLGDVETNQIDTFTLKVTPGLRSVFGVKTIGRAAQYTDPLEIDDGDWVHLNIANYLPFTTLYRAEQ